MVDFSEPQFCDDYGYCICGNDCGAGCCPSDSPCEAHAAAQRELQASYSFCTLTYPDSGDSDA